MTQLEKIKSQIETLSREDLKNLQDWLIEREWQYWDEQVKADIAAGKFDYLLDEEMIAKVSSELKDL